MIAPFGTINRLLNSDIRPVGKPLKRPCRHPLYCSLAMVLTDEP
jgi:hypothetical protein